MRNILYIASLILMYLCSAWPEVRAEILATVVTKFETTDEVLSQFSIIKQKPSFTHNNRCERDDIIELDSKSLQAFLKRSSIDVNRLKSGFINIPASLLRRAGGSDQNSANGLNKDSIILFDSNTVKMINFEDLQQMLPEDMDFETELDESSEDSSFVMGYSSQQIQRDIKFYQKQGDSPIFETQKSDVEIRKNQESSRNSSANVGDRWQAHSLVADPIHPCRNNNFTYSLQAWDVARITMLVLFGVSYCWMMIYFSLQQFNNQPSDEQITFSIVQFVSVTYYQVILGFLTASFTDNWVQKDQQEISVLFSMTFQTYMIFINIARLLNLDLTTPYSSPMCSAVSLSSSWLLYEFVYPEFKSYIATDSLKLVFASSVWLVPAVGNFIARVRYSPGYSSMVVLSLTIWVLDITLFELNEKEQKTFYSVGTIIINILSSEVVNSQRNHGSWFFMPKRFRTKNIKKFYQNYMNPKNLDAIQQEWRVWTNLLIEPELEYADADLEYTRRSFKFGTYMRTLCDHTFHPNCFFSKLNQSGEWYCWGKALSHDDFDD